MLVCRLAVTKRRIRLVLGCSMIAFIMLVDCLKMMIGRSNMTGGRQVMVFARGMASDVGHNAFLLKELNVKAEFATRII
jgi:hypothetical protein